MVLHPRLPAAQLQPRGIDSGAPETLANRLRDVREGQRPRLQQQARARNFGQHPCGGILKLRGQLRKIVEAAEGNRAGCERGQRTHLGARLVGPIAEVGSRQAHQLFGREPVGFARRIGVGVGDAQIHCAQSGRIGIAEVGRLDRRRLHCHGEQAVARGMAGKVHEDVDPIVPDAVGELRVRKVLAIGPPAGQLAQPIGDRVLLPVVVVAIDVELGAIVAFQYRLEEPRHHVLAEIRRYVTDAKPARPRWIRRRRFVAPREQFAEALVLAEYGSRILVRAVIQLEQQITERRSAAGCQFQYSAVGRDGVVSPAVFVINAGQIEMHLRPVGQFDLQPLQLDARFLPAVELDQRYRIVVSRRRAIGQQREAGAVDLDRLGQPAHRLHGLGQREQVERFPRTHFDRFLEQRDRLFLAPVSGRNAAEKIARIGVGRIALRHAAVERLGPLKIVAAFASISGAQPLRRRGRLRRALGPPVAAEYPLQPVHPVAAAAGNIECIEERLEMFKGLGSRDAEDFAIELAQEFLQRCPPSTADRPTIGLARSIDHVCNRAADFQRSKHLGVYGRAKFGTEFKTRLKECGYTPEFVDEFTTRILIGMSGK